MHALKCRSRRIAYGNRPRGNPTGPAEGDAAGANALGRLHCMCDIVHESKCTTWDWSTS